MIRLWLRRAGLLGSCGLLGCGALAACGSSPPTRFYILNDIAPAAGTAASAAAATATDTRPAPVVAAAAAVQLGPVTIAPELDRPQLVTRSGPNRVHVADFERWAAPLADQIRRVLSDDLAARLASGLIVPADEAAGGEPRRTLSVSIDEFYGSETCAVSLRAGWSLSRPNTASLRGTEQLQVPASAPCGEALPAAMSQALALLADRLATLIAAN